MKRFIFLFVALLCCVSATAQVVFVATLQHESTTTQYYGQDALTSAYKAAVDGDVITLSDGTFTWSAGDFNKSITLRGAGINGEKRTIIAGGDMRLATRNKEVATHFEGIRFHITIYIYNEDAQYEKGKIEFIKCFAQSINSRSSGNSTKDSPKVYFYNSILNHIYFYENTAYPKYSIVNSYIGLLYSTSELGNNTSIFDHCIIDFNVPDRYNVTQSAAYCNYLNFNNCIFVWRGTYNGNDINYIFQNTATATNCLSINKNKLFNNLLVNNNNMTAATVDEVFKSFKGGSWDGIETFELTEEAKTKYLGNDSTQVGMQGGAMPFNTTVSYPIITKLKSDLYTTKDGKLTIDVEVDGNK